MRRGRERVFCLRGRSGVGGELRLREVRVGMDLGLCRGRLLRVWLMVLM
jgi:hypothetical protein